eukprot:8302091-Pyramimonas_sp.AAC.1
MPLWPNAYIPIHRSDITSWERSTIGSRSKCHDTKARLPPRLQERHARYDHKMCRPTSHVDGVVSFRWIWELSSTCRLGQRKAHQNASEPNTYGYLLDT